MSKVISLSERKEENVEKNLEEDKDVSTGQPLEESFDEVLKRNAENKRRQEEDRKKANKGVIRSYRLKH